MNIESVYWNISEVEYNQQEKQFNLFFAAFVNTLERYLSNQCAKENIRIPELSAELKVAVEDQLRKIAFRTLILEMKLSNQYDGLDGETEEERYQSFVCKCLKNKEWLRELYQEYPVLYRALMQKAENTADSLTEMIKRFEEDKKELNHRYFEKNPCTAITVISGGDSDSHRKGRSVYILTLDNGEKIVYKPRNLEMDWAYQEFIRWVSENIGMDYWWNWIWSRGNYGWCQWVSRESAETREQLERYYQRNGVLMAVSYLLGSGDIHYENLIAHGEYPVIIDLEMGAGIRRRGSRPELNEAEKLYGESVLRTGLLPMFAWNENGEGINVGAINAGGGDLVPIDIPMVVSPGTINMRIEYGRPVMKEGKNLALLKGEFINPYEFVEQIQYGFERTYQFILEHKTEAEKRINRLKTVPIRFLVSHTQIYTMLLTASYLPNHMSDEEERRKVLEQIKRGRVKNKENEWAAVQEVEEMMGGDVPYFWYTAGERTLYSGSGEKYPDYFAETAVEEILLRLREMNPENLRQQKRLIRDSLLIGDRGKRNAHIKFERNSKLLAEEESDPGIQVAEAVAEVLLENTIWDKEKKNAGWIGMMMAGFRERGYLIKPMGAYLYDGWAGVALFMGVLAERTGKQEYLHLAEILKNQLYSHTRTLMADNEPSARSVGAFSGEASVAYAYQLLYEMNHNKECLDYMEAQCSVLPKLFQCDQSYDVLGGNAGAILVLLNAYDLTGKQIYIDWAKEAGDCLLRTATVYDWGIGWKNPAVDTALTGFAHGASGIMYALAKLGYYSGDIRYDEAAHKAFCFEQHYYCPERLDWADLRFKEDQMTGHKHDTAWCHGWGGIVTAGNLTKKYVRGEWVRELEHAMNRVHPRIKYRKNENEYNLCHGKLGNAALLYGMGEVARAENRHEEIVMELAEYRNDLQNLLGMQECENYGLVGGISGIGYAALCGPAAVGRLLSVRTAENVPENFLGTLSDCSRTNN